MYKLDFFFLSLDGTGVFVVKFMSVVKYIEAICKGKTHVFWLMENTRRMNVKTRQFINCLLSVSETGLDFKFI